MARKNTSDMSAESIAAEQQSAHQQPADGGSYIRCADSGDLTLVARTRHVTLPEDATIDFDSTTNVESSESQA